MTCFKSFFFDRGREWKFDQKIRIKEALGGKIARSSSLEMFPPAEDFDGCTGVSKLQCT